MPMPKATCLSRFANLKPCLVGLLLLLLAPSLALADAPQEVRGTVKDRSGAVVARAQVVLHARRTAANPGDPAGWNFRLQRRYR